MWGQCSSRAACVSAQSVPRVTLRSLLWKVVAHQEFSNSSLIKETIQIHTGISVARTPVIGRVRSRHASLVDWPLPKLHYPNDCYSNEAEPWNPLLNRLREIEYSKSQPGVIWGALAYTVAHNTSRGPEREIARERKQSRGRKKERNKPNRPDLVNISWHCKTS